MRDQKPIMERSPGKWDLFNSATSLADQPAAFAVVRVEEVDWTDTKRMRWQLVRPQRPYSRVLAAAADHAGSAAAPEGCRQLFERRMRP